MRNMPSGHGADALPLSTLQKEIWVDQMLHPDVPLYNGSAYARIDGPIDASLFERALEHVVAQHDALRIVLLDVGALATQRILERAPADLDRHDFSAFEDADDRAHQWMQREVARPFLLHGGLLFKFALIKVAEDRYYWLTKYHHLIVDGWVMTLVVESAAAAYNALQAGQILADEPAPSYVDFVKDDQAYGSSEQFQRDAAYWQDVYSTLPEPLFQRRHDVSRGELLPSHQVALRLNEEFCARMRAFAAEHRTTLNQVILGALYCYSVRIAQRDDLSVGIMSQNRRTSAFKETVGVFSNTVSAWYRLGSQRTFLELLQALHEEAARGAPHRRFPLSDLSRRIGLLQTGRAWPFDVTLSYMTRTCNAHFGGAPITFRFIFPGYNPHGLTIYVEDFQTEDGVRLLFDASGAMFAPDEVEWMARRLELLLGEALRHPTSPICQIPLLHEAERQQILVQWNDTKADFPQESCIHELFEAQVERTPEAVAVVFGDQQLTYRELNVRANHLARRLRALGVGPDVLVGLCVERSPEMVVGLLGILKAGGAYVPLEPEYPRDRLAFMLRDTGAPVLLSQARLAERLPPCGARLLFMDSDRETLANESDADPACVAGPENLSYVIYTSGSTGQPKGVMVTHRNLVHSTTARAHVYSEPVRRSLLIYSFAFDAATAQIFWTLCSGGALVLSPGSLHWDPKSLMASIAAERISHLDCVPSLYALVLEQPGAMEALSSLSTVIVGGEAAPPNLVVAHHRQAPRASLFNEYGPTEATVWSSCHRTTAADGVGHSVSIGRPPTNTQIFILDGHLQPVPVGVPGEIHVGGAGLARGYLNRPELTAERFIANPFSTDPSARLYKTGDLGRFLPDGKVEFLGRIDQQVKIRGFRIELGEIEAVLASHPAVGACAVLAREDSPGDKRLVAYIVLHPRQASAASSLREHLGAQLPEYMLPAAWVFLDALPLTSSGKVDRKALPALAGDRGQQHYVAPRTPVEQLLADTFAQVLGLDRVGLHDDFFASGGHSLLAMQLVHRLRTALGLDLPLRAVFEAPTVAALSQVVAAQQGAVPSPPRPTIVRASRPTSLPLSFGQERLWFLDQLEPGSPVYNVPLALRLQGRLDHDALRRALGEIVRRHEALRTTFDSRGEKVVQVVHPTPSPWPLPVVEIQGDTPSAVEAEVRRQVQTEAAKPFCLQAGPLFRTTALRVDEAQHVLLLTMHHTVSDGWSVDVLHRELEALYTAFVAQQGCSLPELRVQPADVAIWQRDTMQGERLQHELSHWREQLRACPALELPTDHPRPPTFSHRGGFCRFSLEPRVTSALRRLAEDQGATLFMVLLGAFQVLLGRYSRQEDFGVGLPIANRMHEEMAPLIGFFTNTLVLRARLEGNPTFVELLGRVRRGCLEAYSHQDLPFERLVDELGLERDLSRNPLFQVMFLLDNTEKTPLRLPGLEVSTVEVEGETAKFDLTLALQEQENGELLALVEYASDLFEKQTVERLCGHYATLLAGIVESPHQRAYELPLLTDAERRRVLVEWNQTGAPYPQGECIHQLFEAQAARTPEAPAALFGEQRLSYRQLDARANQVAHHLRALGVGPDVLVGLCVERSLEMVIALLGILKAGGAYVPLDPAYPQERLAFMLEDVRPAVVLVQRALRGSLPVEWEPCVLLEDVAALPYLPEGDRPVDVTPQHLAYVLYTSGSAGRPKGVAVEHRGASNLAHALAVAIGIGPESRVLQFASLNFDVSVMEILLALCHGGSLHICSAEEARDPAALMQRVRRDGINVAAFAAAVLAALSPEDFPSLATVIVGGEAAPADAAASWARGRRLFNQYGPTEATVCATMAECSSELLPPVIGRPIANTEIHILDAHLGPVPVGVPGELHIGGAGLARGYLGRPELTREKFVSNPFSRDPAARLYKTGDLARYRPDGTIEFLGRIDHQVKIRGFRIELGEIESVLRQHPSVREAVALVREDSPGDRRLVAYVVPGEGNNDPDALREHLRRTLPEHMLPSSFVLLDALPLSPNGKVDRKALPAPEGAREVAGISYVAPRTDTERALTKVWASVLRSAQVGVHDNFFALGGDSILAIQVVGRLQRAGLHVSVRELFQHQTVAELALVARRTSASLAEQDDIQGALPLTPIQKWFLDAEPTDTHHFNQAMLWTVAPSLSPEIMASALAAVLRQHDALRLRYRNTAAGWVQEHTPEASLPLEQVDLSSVDAGARSSAVQSVADALQAGLSLQEGPLARAAWLDLGEAGARLLLVVHHLAVDGVSWRVLHEDLERACGQVVSGEKPSLGAKTTSFKQWSTRVHRWVADGRLSDELPYWQAQCARGVTPIPVDRDGPLGTAGESCTASVELSEAETTALLRDVGAAYRTEINDVLLTALAEVLAAFCGKDTVCIGLEGHGREALVDGIDVSRTVGWFTSLFPVWLEVPASGDPGTRLKSVKEQLRAVPRRGVGYGWLRFAHPEAQVRDALSVKTSVVFNYLGQLDMAAQGDGLLQPAMESTGSSMSPRMALQDLLSINGGVSQGRLHFGWTYSPAVHDASTIEGLAARFLASLRQLIAHCTSPEAYGYTPSDFPLARLDQVTVDRLLGAARGVEGVYPLSPLQAGMLFHALRDPESPTYTVQLALELGGEVDAAALQAAWRTLLARHAVYRTSFVWQGVPEPLQIVRRDVPFDIAELDVSSLSEADAEARFHAFLAEDRHRGFDLSQPPLLRVTLLRLPGGRTWMVKTGHHILSDGWSGPVVLGELQAAYSAFCRGARPALPDPVPYARYIAWLATRDKAASESFFRDYLRGVDTPSRLGLPRPAGGPPDASREHPELSVALSTSETEALVGFAKRHGLTVNTVLQGALAQVLGRYAGRSDVLLGVITSGRSAPVQGLERMVGLFINTLPLRARWGAADRVVPWLQALQDEQAGVRVHEAVPLYEVQRLSDVGAGQALFDTLLVFENYPVDEAAMADGALSVEAWRSFEQTHYPLTIAAMTGAELALRLSWDPELLGRADVERLWGHLRTLLRDAVAHPQKRLSELAWLTEREVAELAAWNDTAADYPSEQCIHELFEEQARKTPHAVAVEVEDARLSYAELDAEANRLAHYLRRLGVGPEVRVGLCAERSLAMVVGLLGILKAGGAYVPLDPSYPQERLAFMLADARAAVLLTQAHLGDKLPAHNAAVVRLDADAPQWERLPDTAPVTGVSPENAMYVIYTSGSTGRPKGVLGLHRGMVNRFHWMWEAFPFEAGEVCCQKTTIGFVDAVWEIFGPLLRGVRLVVLPEDLPKDPPRLVRSLARAGVTRLLLVPSLLRALLDVPLDTTEQLSRIRYWTTSGEALPRDVALAFRSRLPEAVLLNLYGMSEASADATCFVVRPGDPAATHVGKPIANTRVYLLDSHQKLVPVGAPGEVHLGGVQLARGYLDRPALTAERFLPDPFSDAPGARMYRTGDLARWSTDGQVELLGRMDHQVKIRGFRIELGEVEAALSSHPSVRSCAVLAREDVPGDRRLVAYVVPGEGDCAPNTLREYLRASLPNYMVPTSFVKLPVLPLTSNGKVDRRALPAPELEGEKEPGFIAPRTHMEQTLADAFARVLGRDRVGIHDDFFALGGHSLSVVQLASLVERAGLTVSLRDIFSHPTVAALASRMEQLPSRRSCVVPLVVGSHPGAILLIPALGGHLSVHMIRLAQGMGGKQPVLGLITPPHYGDGAMPSTLQELCARYCRAVLADVPSGPFTLVGYCFGGYSALELAIQLEEAGRHVERVILLETIAPHLNKPATDDFDWVAALLLISRLWGVDTDPGMFVGLSEDQAMRRVVEAMALADLARADAEATLRAILDTQEGHLRIMFEGWAMRVPKAPIHLLRASPTSDHRDAELEDYGWEGHAALKDVHVLPGDHFGIVRPPHIETTIRVLLELLAGRASAMNGSWSPSRAARSC